MTATSSLLVPFVDLRLQQQRLKGELLAAIERVLDQSQFILGPDEQDFETRFAAYCGTSRAIGVASGTCALFLAMRALGIGKDDEVITVPNSFLASAGSIAIIGARPVFVDVGADLNIDPDLIEPAITPRTRAIMPVHLSGRPAQMERIRDIARRRGLVVVEDAAQAVGARYDNRPVGSWSEAGCFSLHPLKNLAACGDGGIVTTDREELYGELLKARNHGLKSRDECEAWGYNCRLDTIQAAILNVKMGHLDRWIAARRAIASRYADALGDIVTVPRDSSREFSVYQTFIIQADRRDELQRHLAARGVDTRVHYPIPLHLQPAAADLGFGRGAFPQAERLADRILSLPIYPELTDGQQNAVIDGIRAFYQ